MTENTPSLTLTLTDGTQISAPTVQRLAVEWAKQQNPQWDSLSPNQQQREIAAAYAELERFQTEGN